MADFSIRAAGASVVERKLGRLLVRFGDLLPLMDRIGRYLVSSTQHRFETSKAPDGTTWKPSIRNRYEAVPRKAGVMGPSPTKTLVQQGHLRDSITHLPTSSAVEIGSNLICAAVHQLGATIVPRAARALVFELPGVGLVHAMQVIIPARPYLGISPADAAGVERMGERYAEEAIA